MQVSDLLVEVRDRGLRRVAQIAPADLDLTLTLRDCAVGEWRLRLPAEHPAVGHLRVPGSGVVVTGPDGVLASGPTATPTVEADLSDPAGIATVEGVTDESLLWARLAYPHPEVAQADRQTRGYDVLTGPAETVMRAFVDRNLGPTAPEPRGVAELRVPPSLGRGATVTKSARFDVLGDLLREIASVAGLRFRVVQADDALRFEVLDLVDGRDTVRFDLANGTLSAQKVAVSPPGLTRAIVAGQGEGADRLIVEEHTPASVEAEELYGPWGRVERFVDQRGTGDRAELEQSGRKLLGEQGTVATTVRAVPSDDLTMRFGVDWTLGDRVTVVVGGQETESAVTAVTVVAGADGVRVGADLGDVDGFDPRGAMGRRVEDTATRVSSLERTAESAGVFDQQGELLVFRPRADVAPVSLPTLPYLTRVGKVAPYYTQGPPRVIWEGETAESGPYAHLAAGWVPTGGQEVLGTRSTRTGTWVVTPIAWGTGLRPRWYPLPLQNGWNTYATNYASPAFTRTSLGLVKLRGLIKNAAPPAGQHVIAQLPEAFRPSTMLMFAAQIGDNGSAGSVEVRPDGTVRSRLVGGGWTSLENVTFWAAAAVPDSHWTPATLQNGFQNYEDVYPYGWARAASYRDPYGVVWERGLVLRPAAPAPDTVITVTSGRAPTHTQHRRTTSGNVLGMLYKGPDGRTSWGDGTASAAFLSLDGTPFVDASSPLAWNPLPLTNGWVDYLPATYSPAGFAMTSDGVVHLRGLVRSGTSGAAIGTLPPGFRPSARLLIATVANSAAARVDVLPDGTVAHVAGSTTWFSLDGICLVADQ